MPFAVGMISFVCIIASSKQKKNTDEPMGNVVPAGACS